MDTSSTTHVETATAADEHAVAPAPTLDRLNRVMAAAGWEISYVDLDLTGAQPKVEIRIKRHDGRWLRACVDSIGRCTTETFQRERCLGMSRNTKGRQPLSPQIDDVFLGRRSHLGARHMLRDLTNYVTDNALHPVALADMRAAWAGVMTAPLRLSHEPAALPAEA